MVLAIETEIASQLSADDIISRFSSLGRRRASGPAEQSRRNDRRDPDADDAGNGGAQGRSASLKRRGTGMRMGGSGTEALQRPTGAGTAHGTSNNCARLRIVWTNKHQCIRVTVGTGLRTVSTNNGKRIRVSIWGRLCTLCSNNVDATQPGRIATKHGRTATQSGRN